MRRVGSTCQARLRRSALSVAFGGSTLSGIALSRMVWQRGPRGQWRKALSQLSMSLACLQPSGEKLWPLLFTPATNVEFVGRQQPNGEMAQWGNMPQRGNMAQRGNGPKGKVWVHTRK